MEGKTKVAEKNPSDSTVCMKQSMPKLLLRFQNQKLQLVVLQHEKRQQ